MPIFADAGTTAIAAFTSGMFLVIGQAVVWLINRKAAKDALKHADNADERAEENADMERYRNLANDALSREKLAYDRAIRAEDKLNLAIADNDRLRANEQNAEGKVKAMELALNRVKEESMNHKHDLEQCRRHIRYIEAQAREKGVHIDGGD